MTKVELEMEAKAFPFQALVGLKDTMKFRLWRPNCRNPKGAAHREKTTPGCFKYQINSLEDASHHKSALRELLGQKDRLWSLFLGLS
jgi:hypothetical protein